MPYQFQFDQQNRIAWCQLEGHISAQELGEFYREAQREADRLDPRAGVIDLSGVTSFEVSYQAVRELAKMRPIIADPGRTRVVIAQKPLLFGIARLFESEGRSTRPNLHVVHTAREAWAILGMLEPQFTPQAK